jgi:hypothetical protein
MNGVAVKEKAEKLLVKVLAMDNSPLDAVAWLLPLVGAKSPGKEHEQIGGTADLVQLAVSHVLNSVVETASGVRACLDISHNQN